MPELPEHTTPVSTEEPIAPVDDSQQKYHRAKMHISNLGSKTLTKQGHENDDSLSFLSEKRYRKSIFTPFFGSNKPEKWETSEEVTAMKNICEAYSIEVHQCLREKENNYNLCQPKVAAFQKCLFRLNL